MLNLLFFIVFGALWIALLWLGIAPDFSKWSHLGLLFMHVLPPVAASTVWWAGGILIKRHKERQAEEHKKKSEAEQQAALEDARSKHEKELRQRRFACDCKLISIVDLAVHEQCDLPEKGSVWIQTVPAKEKALAFEEANTLDAFEPALKQALCQVYEAFGAAAAFPIYIVPPSNVAAIDVHRCLRDIHSQLLKELALPLKLKDGMPSILHLPSGDSAANRVISLFDSISDLPGAVVLAFDSPLSQIQEANPDHEQTPSDTPSGKPGHGVFALLVTHPELPAMVETVANHLDEDKPESMIPFWEKAAQPQGNLTLLTLAPPALREALVSQPPVARIHRAAFAQTGERPGHVLELQRSLTTLLQQAQIQAGLMELPFVNDSHAAPDANKPASPQTTPRCEWLVHNAGDLQLAGSRTAAIANALMHFQIEVQPNAQGTNVVRQLGDLGHATPIGMLAIALAQARATAAPVLCTEFAESDRVAVAFAMPAQTV